MDVREKLDELFSSLNIIVDENGNMDQIDSISFISLIVGIEEEFGIEVPDEFLNYVTVQDISGLQMLVENLIKHKTNPEV